MKRINLLVIFIFFSSILLVYAQEYEKEEVMEPPQGMEILKVGNLNLMVPKGAQVRKKGSLIIVESTSEYVARKFLNVEERLAEIEAGQEDFRKEIMELKAALDEIQKTELAPKKNNK